MPQNRIDNRNSNSTNHLKALKTKILTDSGLRQVNAFLTKNSQDFRDLITYLWGVYEQNPTSSFSKAFIKVLKESKSFNKFVFDVYLAKLNEVKVPVEFFINSFTDCYINYIRSKETGAFQWVEGAVYILLSIYPNEIKAFQSLQHSFDISENIHSGRVIYLDEYLVLTYNSDAKGLGELAFAVKVNDYLWSFDKIGNRVPLKSLRNAKKALDEYKGKPRKGQLVGNDSARFSRFLGLVVKDGYAYMPNHSKISYSKSKGFGR